MGRATVQPMDKNRDSEPDDVEPGTTLMNFRLSVVSAAEVDRTAMSRGTSTSAILREAVDLFLRSRGAPRQVL